MMMNLYTKEQVHRIVDEVLLKMDGAAVPDPEPANLNNDIPQNSSPENVRVTLTVAEAAQVLGICKSTMYELIRAGKVRTCKVGKKFLVPQQALEDWLKKGDPYGIEAC